MATSICLSVRLFVCLFVHLSPVKFVKSFARWQRARIYRIDSDTPVFSYYFHAGSKQIRFDLI